MYHLRKLKSMLLLLLVCTVANAQLENGKVYNFVNLGNSSQSMVITSDFMATITATNTSSYDQLWYVSTNSDGSYSLRNLYNGYYLRSSNATSARWTMVKGDELDAQCMFYCTTAGSGYTLRAINDQNGYGYMHYGANNGGIVCWESGSTATQWTITEVSINSTELDANWEKLNSIDPDDSTIKDYQTALDNLFTDKACTTPKKSLTTEAAITADADYKALPAGLQAMVKKVYLDDWAEDNYDSNKSAWGADYAKKYRVQFYEPYNEIGVAAEVLGLNAHTNLNNPTGIFANEREVLYIMVDGEIETGSELYLAKYFGHGKPSNSYSDGVQLHQGLNVVPSFSDGANYCINYVVHTFDRNKADCNGNPAKANKLSDYADLKIHIEGGYINGYWNKMGDYNQAEGDMLYSPDTDADWDYIEARATQADVTVLGEYITLQFPLNDADTEGNKGLRNYFNDGISISTSIDEWDKVMMWERLVLGVLDKATTEAEAKKSPYSDKQYVFEYTGDDTDGFESGYGDYYNVHGLSFGVGGTTYMYGSWDHCGYHYNTMEAIMVDMPTSAGAHWGPGHEIGHQHQKLLTVNGLTEVTNNLFANVVLWYFGETTSRVNGAALEHIQNTLSAEGTDFFSTTSNVFITTQMYYKLFLYYHVLGYNPKFYPKLFEMLRQDPMTSGYTQSGATTLLHFYKKCCLAAGEDLTEFFRAYGFFRVMDNRLVGDYNNSVYTQTQEDIDEAIAEVKAWADEKGWEENISVLFINDDTGEPIESYKGGTLTPYETADSELGGYASFKETTTADYTYSVSGNTITMEGEGGVGFAIYNAKGEIIAFSDKKTFTVSEECAELIVSGEAQFGVVNGDNTESVPVNVLDTDDTDAKYAALGALLEDVSAIVSLEDETGMKVGYYRKESLTTLKAAYTSAQTVYDNRTTASYALVYEALNQAYLDLSKDDYARIGIVEGSIYRLVNYAYPERSMSIDEKDIDSDGNTYDVVGAATDESSNAQLWCFEASDTDGRYYLKNMSTSTYPGDVTTSVELIADRSAATKGQEGGAYAYELRYLGDGLCALMGATGLHCASSQSYNIVGWGTDAHATQWYITAVTVDATAESRYELENLVQKTEELMEEVGSVIESGVETITLTESNYYCNARCLTTQWDVFSSYDVLCDDNINTYLHTDYSGNDSEDGLSHYIRIDMGENNSVQMFKINYTTRSNTYPMPPTSITIAGSNDAITWYTIEDAYTEGLPTGSGAAITLPTMGNGVAYRYIRFLVNSTKDNQKAGPEDNKHIYFALSELGISKVTYAESLNTKYSSIAAGTLLATFNAHMTAQGVLTTATTAEYESAYNTLKTQYDALLAARDAADEAALITLQGQLSTLITNTSALIAECGSVTPVAGEALTLTTTAGDANNYLTGGPSSPSQGSIDNLLDDNNKTYYVSNWNIQSEHPYLQVKLPDDGKLSEFTFTFTSRYDGNAPTPTKIVVKGSNDGTQFTDIMTFTDAEHDFPEPANNGSDKAVQWTSPTISAGTAYKYLRFTVTESDRSSGGEADGNGFYHFGISEFGLSTADGYTITWTGDEGGATEELMIAAHNEVASAQVSYTNATTEAQLQAAIDRLQADYDALYDAKISTNYVSYTVQVVGGDGTGGVEYKGSSYKHNATFEAPQNLSVTNLAAIAISGYSEGVVTLSGTTITVTYQKIYTVQVTGGDGTGALTYNSTEYTADATITTSQNIDENALTAKSIDGYDAAITVDHTAGTITVKYTVTPLVDTTKYYTFECCSGESHNTTRFISDNGSVIDGRSAEVTRFSFEAADDANGYYIRSVVSGRYLNHKDGGIYASEEKNTVWTIAKTTFSTLGNPYTLTVGGNLYLNNHQTTDCTDGSCTNLRSNLHSSGVGSGNACSLWTLVAYDDPYDKSEMATLLTNTNALVESCYTDGVFNYTGSLYVTEELVTTTESAVTDAQAVYNDNTALYADYVVAKTNLQTAYDNLQNAIDHAWLPVLLTTDHKEPVLYTIKSKRSDAKVVQKVVQYDPADNHMFSIADASTGSAKQAFYFMAGEKDQVYVCPFAAGEQVLSADEVANAAGKVFAKKQGNATYQQWTFVKRTVDETTWYNLQPVGASSYLSNIFGGANKLGFYSSAPESDLGSLFQFESTTVDGSAAYNSLKVYFEEGVKVASSSIVGGDEVGYYPEDAANVYNTAYADTKSLLDTEATYDEYLTAYYTLLAANEALVLNMPEEGKFYTIVSAHIGYASNKLMYATTDNKFRWDGDKTDKNPEAVWVYTEKGYLKNLQTGCFLNNATTWGGQYTLGDNDAKEVSIKSISLDGQLLLTPTGGEPLHADQVGTVVGWHTYDAGSASAWRIVEVEDMSQVNFTLKIGQYRHAGLYLDYATEIPEGLDVFVVHSPDGEDGSILADQIEGSILPARTAVIVKGDEGEYNFTYTTAENTTDTDKFDANLLGGSAYLKYQQRTDADHLCCVFGRKGNEVGLYKNYVEYVDANGTQTVTEKDTDGNESVKSYADTDDGTHFKVSANKIYFEYKASAVANASAFRFRFRSNEEEGTTMIDELLMTGDAVIYNLYGQRVTKVVEPGIYIINGKKAFVSEKMILNND